MPKVLEESTGKVYDLSSDLAVELASRDGYSFLKGEEVHVKTDAGAARVSHEDFKEQQEFGARAETSGEQQQALHKSRMHREHGGIGGRIQTGVETAIDTAGLGVPGAIARAVAPEYHKGVRERAQENPLTRGVVGGVTAVGTALATGGTGGMAKLAKATPLGRASVAGDKLIKSGKTVRGMAKEGAIEGAGFSLSEEMLQDDVNLERALGNITTGTLTGGALGGGMGVFSKALGKGLQKVKRAVDAPSSTAPKPGVVTSASDDATALVDDFKIHRESDIDAISVMLGGDKKVMTQQRGGKGRMVRLLDDSIGLAERPSGMLAPLRKEAQLIQNGLDNADEMIAKGAAHDASILASLAKHTPGTPLKGKVANTYGDWAGKKFTRKSAAAGVGVSKANFQAFKEAIAGGEMAARRAETIKRLPELLDSNRQLQQRTLDIIEAGKAQPASFAEKAAVGAAYTVGAGAATGVLPQELSFLAPTAGAFAAGKMGTMMFGRMAKASNKAQERTQKAIDLFIKGGKIARKVSVPAATKILAGASFGPEEKADDPLQDQGPLLKAYRAREKEIYRQVMLSPEGPIMKPSAREKVYEELSGVRAMSPSIADKMETHAAKRVAFIATKLPKRPDSAAMRLGPDTWRPSDMAMREFARYVAALEDPGGVFERVADGTVTPEDAETIREVYPEQFQEFQEQVMMEVQALRKALPYEKRLALSIFTGVPVDPAMDPRVLGLLQGHFTEEPGGGLSAPKPNPQFGSVTKSVAEPTPGQSRAK